MDCCVNIRYIKGSEYLKRFGKGKVSLKNKFFDNIIGKKTFSPKINDILSYRILS